MAKIIQITSCVGWGALFKEDVVKHGMNYDRKAAVACWALDDEGETHGLIVHDGKLVTAGSLPSFDTYYRSGT